MENGVKTDDTLTLLIKQFEDAADSSVDHRREAESARDYYDGNQWTAAERATLQKRRQPIITDRCWPGCGPGGSRAPRRSSVAGFGGVQAFRLVLVRAVVAALARFANHSASSAPRA